MGGEQVQKTPEQQMNDFAAREAEAQEAARQADAASKAAAEKGDDIKNELDELLDEIDGVLEVNAEEFVKSYIQKGGQ